ncbi:ATP synthase F1 subunit delta [Melissococcus plutonius]|uniref:ATP synthase subunit delta n=2 Tax=Melissococcus plutonius TaxID=33970 RepID=F3YBW8_MELPT|nr:ATP synthase F1 subunit delta [Melissococcus plutonius]BAL61750.1 ATP synthase subunit delta [Melissococcus plutonius DAT561]AIM25265.1 ATP synthase subunit delta [Melissococcus plutonius S1]KMT23947.1 ATP synthase subunit delta [Melissococcus plutonius]KMT24470.1 ATP synthase subunit delta [Melissococcus plutonius]KMT26043.1 ATP synthase subunit delta [Melissococcus plutonius]
MKLDKFTVGRRYGKALFELAIEKNEIENIYQDLLSLREIYHQIPDLGNMLSDVRLTLDEKKQIVQPLFDNFTGITLNFLRVVYNYGRMNDLLLMIDEYERRFDEHESLILGTVITAVPLTKEQHQLTEKKAAKILGYKQAQFINLIDPTIIGGAIIEANHKVIDGSVHSQLLKMQQLLLK